jgi:hypothetical protein
MKRPTSRMDGAKIAARKTGACLGEKPKPPPC